MVLSAFNSKPLCAFHHAKLTGQRSENLRKMERRFPINLGQPIEMALVILNSFSEFPN